LPSSHSSPWSTVPSPQTSVLHAAEQPSPETLLPSSHSSGELNATITSVLVTPAVPALHRLGWRVAPSVPPLASKITMSWLVAPSTVATAQAMLLPPLTSTEKSFGPLCRSASATGSVTTTWRGPKKQLPSHGMSVEVSAAVPLIRKMIDFPPA